MRIKAHMLEVLDFLREIGDVPTGSVNVSDLAVEHEYADDLDNILNCLDDYPRVNDKGEYEINPVLNLNGNMKFDCSIDPLESKRSIATRLFQKHLISEEDYERIREMLGSEGGPSAMLAAAVRERDYMLRAMAGKQFRECSLIRENMREIIEFIRGLDGFEVTSSGGWRRVDELLLQWINTSNGHGRVDGVRKVEEELSGDPERFGDPDSHGNIYWTPSYLAFEEEELGELWFSENRNEGPDPLRAVRDLSGIKKRIIDWAVARGARVLEVVAQN